MNFLVKPLSDFLIWLYYNLPGRDFGVAVIIFTILIKLALYPLNARGIKSQRALQELQPKVKELQERLKNNKAEQAKAMLELYKKEKVSPFSGILILLLQLPILFALFQLFGKNLETTIGQIDTSFLGLVDLAKPSMILAVLTGVSQFWQTKMMFSAPAKASLPAGRASTGMAGMMQKQMLYFFPLFSVFILWKLPSALALYWFITTIFTIGQQYITLKKKHDRQ